MAKKRTVENKTAIKNSVGRIAVFGLLLIAQLFDLGFLDQIAGDTNDIAILQITGEVAQASA